MPYGQLNPKQRQLVAKTVKSRTVYDLGAGDLQLSRTLVDLGALKVVAIDKEAPLSWDGEPRIEVRRTYFHDIKDVEPIEIAFVSWPSNYVDWGLINLIGRAQQVIYLGKNTDGTSCGSLPLFEHFKTRELLGHIPTRPNTLLVYGEQNFKRVSPLVGEEIAGGTTVYFTYDDVLQAVREL